MATVTTYKQLAQRNLTTTSDTVLYRVPSISVTTFVKVLVVCNTTAVATTYSLWVNQNGAVSGDQFALAKAKPLAANAPDWTIFPGDSGIILDGANATVIVKAGTANAITVTLYGVEVSNT